MFKTIKEFLFPPIIPKYIVDTTQEFIHITTTEGKHSGYWVKPEIASDIKQKMENGTTFSTISYYEYYLPWTYEKLPCGLLGPYATGDVNLKHIIKFSNPEVFDILKLNPDYKPTVNGVLWDMKNG